MSNKPAWLKVKAPQGENYTRIKHMLGTLKLATVCQEARCPNMGECWSSGTATIMLMGEVCTRGCKFCNVKTGNPRGILDPLEPEKVAHALAQMQLHYVVVTSVDRDDLPDQGAHHFARSIRTIREINPELLIEVLTPDFSGNLDGIKIVADSGPHVFAHNIETVPRLQKSVRDLRAGYEQSLKVLRFVKEQHPRMLTKSSLMLGLGETDAEILQSLNDLRSIACDVVTFGQYLQPTPQHLSVKEFVTPEKFSAWQKTCEDLGFMYCASGPLVRSSYRAGEFFMAAKIREQQNRLQTKEYPNEKNLDQRL